MAELRSLGDAYYNGGRYERGRGAVPRAAAQTGLERRRAQRLCRGRGGLRTEVEAADHGAGAGARRIRTTKTARGGCIC